MCNYSSDVCTMYLNLLCHKTAQYIEYNNVNLQFANLNKARGVRGHFGRRCRGRGAQGERLVNNNGRDDVNIPAAAETVNVNGKNLEWDM